MSLPKGYGALSINLLHPNWREEIAVHNTPEYKELFTRISWQGNERCYFCGFPDGYFLEVHHLNHDHSDFSKENLVLCCSLCHKTQHLGWVGMASMGKILYLPSIESDDDNVGFYNYNLEVLSLINRFYLMQGSLTERQRKNLKVLPFTQAINSSLEIFQHVDFNAVLQARMNEDRNLKRMQEEYSQASSEEKEEKAKAIQEYKQQKKNEQAAKFKKSKELQKKAKDSLASLGLGELANLDEDSHVNNYEELDVLDSTDYLAGDIDIMDLTTLLCRIDQQFLNGELQGFTKNPCDNFLEEQRTGVNGRMAIWFNPNVFAPLFPEQGFTLEERVAYYQQSNFFNPEKMQTIIQDMYNTTSFLSDFFKTE